MRKVHSQKFAMPQIAWKLDRHHFHFAMTLNDHFRNLSSESPSDRGVAALVLNRSGIPEYEGAVRKMVLCERHHLPLMTVSHLVVEWNDGTVGVLLDKTRDDRVVFTLLEAARIQRRFVPPERILDLLNDRSIFVRLAALKQAVASRAPIDLVSHVDRLREDAEAFEFLERPNMPSPVFRYKSKFLRLLAGIRWIILQRGAP